MGVSLRYETEDAVDYQVARQILAETALLESQRVWSSEPIHFFDPATTNQKLAGSSKVPPFYWVRPDGGGQEIDPKDWHFITWWDFRFIIDTLCRWSVQYKLRWKLSCEGEEVGRVCDGRMNLNAEKFLRQMAEEGRARFNEALDHQRAAEIIRRYEAMLE